MSPRPAIDATRVIAELAELEQLTGGTAGAQRLCWSEGWRSAREWLSSKLEELGLEPEPDQAGNLWAYLDGEAEPALVLGSHLDSVPDGGRLDGALGVVAALGVLRSWAESGQRPPRTLALVDFADEEGARFGRSLFGSSAVAGTLRPAELRELSDSEGAAIADVLAANDVDLEAAPLAAGHAERIGSYLELHIEQGPVLDNEGSPCAAVAGCAGIERELFVFAGQASHAGTTPMDARRDAGLAAAEAALVIEAVARERGGVGTTGRLELEPGIVTAVAGRSRLAVDLRHSDATSLATMLAEGREQAAAAAAGRGCTFEVEPIWRIAPVAFDAALVAAAREACIEAGGRSEALTSGALHDAAEIAAIRPAAMVFCASTGGISHAKEEDTTEASLRAGIEAFAALAARALSAGH